MSDVLVVGRNGYQKSLVLDYLGNKESNRRKEEDDDFDIIEEIKDTIKDIGSKIQQDYINNEFIRKVEKSLKDGKLKNFLPKYKNLTKALRFINRIDNMFAIGPLDPLFSLYNIATAKEKDKAIVVELADYTGGVFGGITGFIGGGLITLPGGPFATVPGTAFGTIVGTIGGSIFGRNYAENHYDDWKKWLHKKWPKMYSSVTSNYYGFRNNKKYTSDQYLSSVREVPAKYRNSPLKYFGDVMKRRGENNTEESLKALAFDKTKYSEKQYVNNATPGEIKRPPVKYIGDLLKKYGKTMKERGKNNDNTSANLYAFNNKKYSAQQSMNNADPGAIKRPPLIYAGSVMRQRGIKNKDVTSNSYAFNNKKYTLSQYPKSHSASTNKRSAGSVLNRFVKRTINRPKPKRMYNKIKKALNKLGRFFGKRFANGGLIGSTTYGMIGEDGPEMIIPLSGQRRQRGLDLWNQAGDMLGVPKYAEGAIKGTKGTSALPSPKSSPVKAPGGKRKATSGKKSGTGRISVGNIAIELEGVASTDILKTLQEQKGQIAHEVKNILSEAMKNASRNVSAVH